MRYLEITAENCTIEEYFEILKKVYGEKIANDQEMQVLSIALEDFSALIKWCKNKHIDWRASDNGISVIFRWVHSWL